MKSKEGFPESIHVWMYNYALEALQMERLSWAFLTRFSSLSNKNPGINNLPSTTAHLKQSQSEHADLVRPQEHGGA